MLPPTHMGLHTVVRKQRERGKVVEELSPLAGNGLLYLNVLSSELHASVALNDLRLLVHKQANISNRWDDVSPFRSLSCFEQSEKSLQKRLIGKKVRTIT